MKSLPGLQLLLGPAGSGKSRRLREALVEALRAGREAHTLLLVPTASYRDHTRNQILRESGLAGFSPAAVCTFRDLLRRLVPDEQIQACRLTAARRDLLIRRLLHELSLSYLEPVREFPGFRETLAEAMEEVRRAGMEPDDLESALHGSPPASAGRHRAFAQFFRAYHAAVRDAGLDDSRIWDQAGEEIGKGRLPVGLLLVDGFADFTAAQRRLLAALLRSAAEAQVALTLDSQHRDLFYQAERSRAWLKSEGFGPGKPVAEVLLEGNHRAGPMSLAALEQAIREGRAEQPPPLWQQEEALEVFAAADRRDEAELIAREVLRLARSGFRYREVGIIVRRPADYAPLLRGVFRRLGIPLREFVPLSLAETAIGRHLADCLELFVPGTRPESLLRWLKSPYCPIHSTRLVEKFEYRVVARLAEAREGRWEGSVFPGSLEEREIGKIERLDAELLKLSKARDARALAAWTAGMWKELTEQREIGDGAGPERVRELRGEAAVFRRVEALLPEVVEAAEAEGAGEMSFADFRELLRAMMANEQYLIRDRRQDAVNLMNPFEARQWELRAVFVAGLVEKEFPAPAQEALFLDDEDRRRIERARRLALPTTAYRVLDERLLFYLAATRARERVYFTYPQTDTGGKRLLRSFFLRDVAPLIPERGQMKRGRSEIVFPPRLSANASDLLALVHAELAAPTPLKGELGRALALYERLRSGGATRRAALALAPRPDRLGAAAVAALRQRALRFSPSSFNKFVECPYKYFAEKSLKLGGPALPEEVGFLEEGNIAHATIEQWERGGRSSPIGEVLDRCFEKKTAGMPPGHLGAKSREEIRRFLERFAAAEEKHSEIYRTPERPEYVELKFDGSKNAALELTLPDGSVIRVEGRLDRVEVVSVQGRKLGLVVDFKYSKDGFKAGSLEELKEGLELQLPVYLLAMKELMGLEPAGAELYPLKAKDSRRCGVYHEDLAAHIFQGSPPQKGVCLTAEQFDRLMEMARKWIRRHATSIRDGVIAVLPRRPDRCRQCDFYDLCRVKEWEVEREREQRQAR